MKAIGRLRDVINRKLVFHNAELVKEIKNHYEKYGRSSSVWKRAVLVCSLLVKYDVLKKNAINTKERKIQKMEYPESGREKNRKDLEQILHCESERIVFDAVDVLFYIAITERQLLTIYETRYLHIGFSDSVEDTAKILLEKGQVLEEILSDYVFDNEEMHDVYNQLIKKGKKVFICNNTKFSDLFIKKVMEKYGYTGELTTDKKETLVTAHPMAGKYILYKGRNCIGYQYRPYHYTNVYQAVYCQIVNLQLHNRQKERTLFYEYGFAGGGPLTCGFCQYLNQIAEKEKIEKFLFVARDGFIIRKIYERHFKKIDTEYLNFSRFASYELIFNDFPEEYIDKNIKTRMYRENCDNRIGTIFKECDLGILVPYLGEYQLSIELQLNDSNYLMLKECILEHKEEVAKHFQTSCEAAKKYFLDACRGYKKVCVVDLGWHGKSIVYLKHLIEKQYGSETKVIGAMIGAFGDDVTQNYIAGGLIYTYAFSDEYWRHTGVRNGSAIGDDEIICIESLFSAETDTLLRYTFNEEGETDFIYGKKNRNKEKILEMHSGISDFAEKIVPVLKQGNLTISSRDAYTPLDCYMRNEKLMHKIRNEYYEEKNAINGF